MGLQQQVRVLGTLRQAIELLHQLSRHLVLPSPAIKPVEAEQRPEELRRVFHLCAELPGPRIGALDLRGRLSLAGVEGERQDDLQVQLLPGPLAGVREPLEYLQSVVRWLTASRLAEWARARSPARCQEGMAGAGRPASV